MLLRLAQAECRTRERKVEKSEGNQSKRSEITCTKQAKASEPRGAGGVRPCTPAGSGRGHCPHSRQILCPSLFIQALPFALCFALQGLEKTSLQKYQEEYTGMYSEFKSFWN